jgi:hypothetical protein
VIGNSHFSLSRDPAVLNQAFMDCSLQFLTTACPHGVLHLGNPGFHFHELVASPQLRRLFFVVADSNTPPVKASTRQLLTGPPCQFEKVLNGLKNLHLETLITTITLYVKELLQHSANL